MKINKEFRTEHMFAEEIADEINVIHEAYIRAAIEAFAESKNEGQKG